MSDTTLVINSVADLIAFYGSLGTGYSIRWFRGQGNFEWSLKPSVTRAGRGDETVDLEIAYVKKFKQNAVAISQEIPSHEYQWMFLMQHYRLPTRLLDWSESPLVGLYFAVENTKEDSSDAALWCLDPRALNQHANIEPKLSGDIPSFSDDEILENYLPSKVAAERNTKLKPAACIGPRNSRRMYAQQGVFTITHMSPTPIEEVGDRNHIKKLRIPAASKETIRKELKFLGITKLSLFPELENVALLAMEALNG